jgi:protein-L-isoaspartate(D-aspartate) O-methyltransferase
MPASSIDYLLKELRTHGIGDARVLDAMASVPRDLFVEQGFEYEAFANRALPIDCGQTISQPYIVAYMTEALEITPGSRVLEIGTGSGYQTAILSHLAAKVYTVERHLPLLQTALARFDTLGLTNIQATHGDGYQGWEEHAPFDRIMVTAAFPSLPPKLTEQLIESGILVTPLGYETISQRLWKIVRTAEGLEKEALLPVVFVPMIPGLPLEGSGSDDQNDES